MIREISLSKLIEGGVAMFAAIRRNQGIDKVGRVLISPLVRNRLRVWVDSYIVLAPAKRPDEDRPWAIIIRRAP